MIEKRIGLLWTLRCLFGPCIESMIAIDRYLYVKENLDHSQWEVKLIPVFNYDVSQRNLAIVAYRKS